MDISRFIKLFPDTYHGWGTLTAYPKVALHYTDILDHVQGMTTPSVMHLLNTAVSCLEPDEVYLEVGTWRGATLIGALIGNDGATAYAVDNDTMDEHDGDERSSQDVWRENVDYFNLAARATYVNGSVPAVWENRALTGGHPVGVYLFDGDKSTPEAAYDGLEGVLPFLSDEAMIFCDDANTPQIRTAVHRFSRKFTHQMYPIIDMPTPTNCWGGFWNGVIGIAWSRKGGL